MRYFVYSSLKEQRKRDVRMTINKSKHEIHQDDDKLNLILTLRLSERLSLLFSRRIWSAVDSSLFALDDTSSG